MREMEPVKVFQDFIKDPIRIHLKQIPMQKGTEGLPSVVAVDCMCLWNDLDGLLGEIEATLRNDANEAEQFLTRFVDNRSKFPRDLKKKRPDLFDGAAWRTFLATRRLEEDS